MGMSLSACLGFGIQVNVAEEEIRVDSEDLEDLYNNKLLVREFGGYEWQDDYVFCSSSVIRAVDWGATDFNELQYANPAELVALREFCKKYNIEYEPKWWLVPAYG